MNGRLNKQMSLCQLDMYILLNYSIKQTRTTKKKEKGDRHWGGRQKRSMRDQEGLVELGFPISIPLLFSWCYPYPHSSLIILTLLLLGNKATVIAGALCSGGKFSEYFYPFSLYQQESHHIKWWCIWIFRK